MAAKRTDAETAFWALIADDGSGLRTSNGLLFNHTIFARDVSMIGRWIIELGPDFQKIARGIILSLCRLQGTRKNPRSEEEPGRIHNEFRDYSSWEGPAWLKLGGRLVSLLWGGSWRYELTYIALDTTPLFILLVCRYAELVGPGILNEHVQRRDGQTVRVADCLAAALDWLSAHQTADGFVAARRRNSIQLYYQTWRDSHTAYIHPDGRGMNLAGANVYLETQFMAVDAWRYAARLLPERAKDFNERADRLAQAVFRHFWDEDEQYFWGALEADRQGRLKPVKTPSSAAGWLLDSTIFDGLPQNRRRTYLGGIMRRLSQPDFVTPVGLRARARGSDSRLRVADYHGSWTVWPVDTFVYARGLHRQGFDALARAQEERLFAGINTTGSYNEYFLVTPENKVLYHPHHVPRSYRGPKVPVQIIPEHNLAWTIAAALLIERGALPHVHNRGAAWQADFEKDLVDQLPPIVKNPVEDIPFRPANRRGAARVTWLAARQWARDYLFQRS